ncbi:MAG: DUF4358 domain-containing protein [Oscillospiraceae bacterium]|nr:DUF4358 domain-containing protein [Oscillospiraceae bacterium]
MKKTLVIIFAFVMLFALVSCGESKPSFTMDTKALVDDLHKAQLFLDTLTPISENALNKVIGVKTDHIVEFTYEMGTGVTGEELCVITCDSEEAAKEVFEQVKAHRDDYIKQYESYAPDAIPRMEYAVLEQKGVYVVYVAAEANTMAVSICGDYLK